MAALQSAALVRLIQLMSSVAANLPVVAEGTVDGQVIVQEPQPPTNAPAQLASSAALHLTQALEAMLRHRIPPSVLASR
jgi:hypothetical protein